MSRVENMVRKYDGFTLNIPKWEIPDQGITALSGPSGAGKTTVFRMLMGLESCPGLKWIFKGEDLAQLPVPQRNLGVVFQSLELFPHMTAEENILFAAKARAVAPTVAQERLATLAQDLRMQPYLKRKAAILSGGEAQRVALARAVIAQPRFLFLDDPFWFLDAELRAVARALVKRVIEKFQFPTLLITHDEEDIKAMADTVVRIKDGQLV
jgi:ABC-type sugar transport system ATPase subunit